MLGSLYKKLLALFITTMILTLSIILSFSRVGSERDETKAELDKVVDLQLSVDLLRSQLWVFLQFGDKQSLDQVEYAKEELATKLQQYRQGSNMLDNIIRMNRSLSSILEQEKEVYFDESGGLEALGADDITARGLLHSRYNMIVQNITEELAYVHNAVMKSNDERQNLVMKEAALWLVACSVVVTGIAWWMFFRFRVGFRAMKNAIVDLTEGKLDTQIKGENFDSEFLAIAKFFNKMTKTLRETTVTKDELELEVRRQTEQLKQKQEQLIFLSEHDSLTNIMNRRAFDSQLESSILNAKLARTKLALFFIDLDNFKDVNDTCGHDAGDAILIAVAERLANTIRETDFAGRIGGDEFLVCLDHLHDFDIVPSKAQQLIDAINEPITFNEHSFTVGASIGVSYFPDQTLNKETLLSIADEAMYRAKQLKRSAIKEHDNNLSPETCESVVTLASVKQ